jgi:1-deoxy-D-xylulose-5-phosphate synthase
LKFARETGRIITLEENVLEGGFGGRVLEVVNSSGLSGVKVKMIGLPDSFIEHGDRSILMARYGLSVEEVLVSALKLMGLRNIQSPRRKVQSSGGSRLDR